MTKMHDLITRLNAASRAYYQENREIISDLEYDALYDELVKLEAETRIILASSPTQKVGYEIVSTLTKAPHDIPMLSLDKTKDITALEEFIDDKKGLLLWKLDGLSIVLRYENGELKQALTRGNGQIGEDVTHNAKVFANIPLAVPYTGNFWVRGEAVITFDDFETINNEITSDDKYKNPRNLCSGTVRQLNSEIASKRRVYFYAFGAVATEPHELKSTVLTWLGSQGFDVVTHEEVTTETVAEIIEKFKSQIPSLPIATDGLVLTYDDIAYSASLGATSKFPRDSIAFKWADDLSETTLHSIEWNPSRTGLINPVAIFNPVDIEGSQVSRASLHNVSILRALELGVGDTITVYKANMIIPQVAENLTRSNTITIPTHCPVCDSETQITTQASDTDSEVLICPNEACGAKQIQSLVHFVSRDGLNIEGLSEQTLEKFISHGIISTYTDLFTLSHHEKTITSMEGFGQRSYDKLLTAIEKARDVALPNFIYALGIRHVGLANAKLLCAHYNHDFEAIVNACISEFYQDNLAEIKGYGEAIAYSLNLYFTDENNLPTARATLEHLQIQIPASAPKGEQPLDDLIFVITGDVNQYQNRKALQQHIETLGGKVATSVSTKTSYLINNDATSASSKNKKAAQLGVPIITEDDFIKMIK